MQSGVIVRLSPPKPPSLAGLCLKTFAGQGTAALYNSPPLINLGGKRGLSESYRASVTASESTWLTLYVAVQVFVAFDHEGSIVLFVFFFFKKINNAVF